MVLLQLFYEFFQIGLFAFGGGLAAIPFLQQLGARTEWFTQTDLANMIAVSESTPGPIGVNMATYVGFETAGIPGAVVATLALALPSIIVTLIVMRLLARFQENRIVGGAFYGLRPAAVGLIAAACIEILRISLFRDVPIGDLSSLFAAIHWKAVVLAAILFPLIRRVRAHPIVFLAGSAVIGIVFKF